MTHELAGLAKPGTHEGLNGSGNGKWQIHASIRSIFMAPPGRAEILSRTCARAPWGGFAPHTPRR